MIIGFTGTRLGMNEKQKSYLHNYLTSLTDAKEFHHGDCIGADEQAHDIARGLNINVYIHPPIVQFARAFKTGTMYPAKSFIERNHDIVDSCDLLIATPNTRKEKLRSGTWATVRYARKQHKAIKIIYPDL
jgi:hypothetical protein